jgi:polyphosphate kinase
MASSTDQAISANPEPQLLNRDLSWLEFNQRVFNQAQDRFLPLLERLKFLAIAASNLDEFYMVRVGSMHHALRKGDNRPDLSGLTADQQLRAVRKRVQQMMTEMYDLFLIELEHELSQQGIIRLAYETLTTNQLKFLEQFFQQEICSVMSPIAADTPDRFPKLFNQSMALCVRLKPHDGKPDAARYRVIPLGRSLPRFISMPGTIKSGTVKYEYVLLEEIASLFVQQFFHSEHVLECVTFRVTRNADFDIPEMEVDDLMEEMEDIIDARNQSECVRLEIRGLPSEMMRDYLLQSLNAEKEDVINVDGPLELSAFMRFGNLSGFGHLRDEPWEPQPSPHIEPNTSMFETLTLRDIVLVHPYESFDPVVKLLQEAADDPDVLAIKQTLYRTARDSKIVAALIRAAQKGKYVTAVVELKARFDEARNIDWARSLEQAGVYVLYGVKGLKTHAKICVIVRRETTGIKRYVHYGTGNYNEATAKLYTDVSFLTSNDDLGEDAVNFFNTVTGDSLPQRFHKIEMAPFGLRQRLLDLISLEISHAENNQVAFIRGKINSLVDPEMIHALYKASQKGVQIQLNVRGICCLKPGVPGLSDNIQVVSIVDRYLEHARIFHFHHGGDERVFISSADWMQRNLDRRIELLTPVEDPACRDRLISILAICLNDRIQGKQLMPDGTYTRLTLSSDQTIRLRAQEFIQKEAEKQFALADKKRTMIIEPHIAPDSQ